ncbi:MAG: MotA/TolQ/ExbB proton channel family protein [Lentisphaeria bacterium]|nr:MotA/TolQ/ExbB proton channel family protein [Lentisphaeria bacterium]NQZ70492.1 MotA/TolQ/ExbB proton channel family protein [Lentisphaeria bacterium]
MSDTINCPECRKELSGHLARCPHCHASIFSTAPWREDKNFILIPLALVFWGLTLILFEFYIKSEILDDFISKGIIGLGIYGIALAIYKVSITREQTKSFLLVRKLIAEREDIDERMLGIARSRILRKKLGAFNRLLPYQRLHALFQLKSCSTKKREQLSTLQQKNSESDWDSLDSSFAHIQYLIWLLPSLGFLGTVYGMTNALSSFNDTISSQSSSNSDTTFIVKLGETAGNLGTAFNTTLMGLACVIPVLFLSTYARKNAQILLEKLDKFFLEYSSNILLTPDQDMETELAAIPPDLPKQDDSTEEAENIVQSEHAGGTETPIDMSSSTDDEEQKSVENLSAEANAEENESANETRVHGIQKDSPDEEKVLDEPVEVNTDNQDQQLNKENAPS